MVGGKRCYVARLPNERRIVVVSEAATVPACCIAGSTTTPRTTLFSSVDKLWGFKPFNLRQLLCERCFWFWEKSCEPNFVLTKG